MFIYFILEVSGEGSRDLLSSRHRDHNDTKETEKIELGVKQPKISEWERNEKR